MACLSAGRHSDNVLIKLQEGAMNYRSIRAAFLALGIWFLPISNSVGQELMRFESLEINFLASALSEMLVELGGHLWFFNHRVSLFRDGSMVIEKRYRFVFPDGYGHRCVAWYILRSDEQIEYVPVCEDIDALGMHVTPLDLLASLELLVRVAKAMTGRDANWHPALLSEDVTVRPKLERIIAHLMKKPGFIEEYGQIYVSISLTGKGTILIIRTADIPVMDPATQTPCPSNGIFTYNNRTRKATADVVCSRDPQLTVSQEQKLLYLMEAIGVVSDRIEKAS